MTVAPSQKNISLPLWRQIQRDNFTRFEPLADYLELSQELRTKILERPRFAINIPFRLAAKMAKNTLNDPILRQFVPLDEELIETPGFVPNPLQDERFRKSNKVLHKYQGRALILASSACAMHCRFCFRQNFPYETAEKKFDEELAYIRADETLSEIILSGGDPLSLSDGGLANLLRGLAEIPHVKRIRFHSRFPIGIPERIDNSFIDILSSFPKAIVFVVHCNHPLELDADVVQALKKLQFLGIPVLNQSVLLKGINDDAETLLTLSDELIQAGIIPYYLHLMDALQGGGHFDVSEERGLALIRAMQTRISGFGIPRLVREIPGYPSKYFAED